MTKILMPDWHTIGNGQSQMEYPAFIARAYNDEDKPHIEAKFRDYITGSIEIPSENEVIAGRTLFEWQVFARRDDCLDYMVPSDLRELIAELRKARNVA